MPVSLGTPAITRVSIGSAAIQKVSIGTDLLWSSAAEVRDDFNRASLGNNWSTKTFGASGTPTLVSNRVRAGAQAGGISDVSEQVLIYTATAVSGDDHLVRASLAGAPADIAAGLVVRANTTLRELVIAKICTDSEKSGIFTVIAGQQKLQKGGVTSNFKTGDVAEFRVSGNVYELIRNPDTAPKVVVAWTDTGNIVAPSPARRYGGLVVSASNNWANDQLSPDLDDFIFKDI